MLLIINKDVVISKKDLSFFTNALNAATRKYIQLEKEKKNSKDKMTTFIG